MNKIFKVIWNHTAQRFVVTSELTKSNGKSSSTDHRIEPTKAIFALGVAGAALLGSAQAMAATASTPAQYNGANIQSGGRDVYISMPAGTNQAFGNSILIGENAQISSTAGGSTVIGTNAIGGSISTVIGSKAKSLGEQDVVIGAGAEQRNTAATSYSVVIGRDAVVGEKGSVAVSIGYKASANNAQATAIGGNAVANGPAGTAIGHKANAEGGSSLAMGFGASATASNTVALGVSSVASGFTSFAGGSSAKARQSYSVAIGAQSDANGANGSTAIGWSAGVSDTAESGLALGAAAKVNGERGVAIGRGVTSNGTFSVGVGTGTYINGARSATIGSSNVVGSTSSDASALGNRNLIGATTIFNTAGLASSRSIADTVAVVNSKAVGNDNYISSSNTYVLGSGIGIKNDGVSFMDTVEDSVYLGNDSTITASADVITADNAGSIKNLDTNGDAGATSTAGSKGIVTNAKVGNITYGTFAGAKSVGAVSVGASGNERRIVNMAAGEISKTSTDAINGSQLYAVAAELGKGFNVTNADGTNNINILPGNNVQFVNGTLTTANVKTLANGGASVTFDVDKGAFNPPNDGTLAPNPADTGVATVTDVADAVNAGYWKVGNATDVVNNVHFGDDVRFTNGTNTTVTVKPNGVSRTDVTIDTDFAKLPTENTTTANITNNAGTIKVDVNTGKGAYAADGTVNDNGNGDKIANISSVVELVSHAGWNIYQETTADKKDLVVAGDNIVFAKGANTTVSVETTPDGKTTTVKYDVDLANVNTAVANTSLSVADGKVETPAEGDKLVNATTVANAINGSGWQTTLTDGTAETINPGDKVNYVDGKTTTANVVKDAKTGNVNVTFEVNKQEIAATTGTAGLKGTTTNRDNFVTAGDVIDTINNVYWVATSDTDGGSFATAAAGHAKSNAEVKAGNTVTFKAGKGLSIKQDGTNFTYAVATGGLSSDTDVNNIGTTLGKANANEADGTIATVGDVANAINHAGWVTQTSTGDTVVINPGDVVNYVNGKNTTANITANAKGGVDVSFDVDLPDTKVNGDAVSGDINFVNGKTTTVTNDNGKIKVEVNTGDSSVENGKAKSTTDDDAAKVATVGDIVDTINKVYHSVNSSKVDGTNGESTYTANGDSKIKAGGTVNYNAGQNIKISGTGNDIVFSTTENVTFKNADVTNNLTVAGDTTVNNFTVTPDSKIDMGGNIISNVSSGVAPTDAVNVKQLHDAIGDATSSLVWKVTDNNNAANVTNVGNQTTVSFNNGEGTSAIVDGTNVTYNVNVDGTSTQITYVDKDGNSLTKNADGTYSKADGSAVDAKDVTGQVSVAFGEVSANTTTGVVSTPDTVEKVASTKDVRDAINGSGFTLTTSNSSTGAVSGTTSELINPGETITIDAGNNINITQSGNKVSVATSMTPTFTTVQVGGNSGPVMSGDANGDVKVAKADGSAAKITNVAPGEVSRTSTDAVNGSQLYAVANGIDNKFGDIHNKINRNNKDLRAGVAGANAAAALPQVFKSGRSMVAASAGTFKGQSAVAVGYSRASDNGKLILKLQGNANSRGDVGGGVGVGYQW